MSRHGDSTTNPPNAPISFRESANTNSRCRNCNSHVTEQFARVFGTNADVAHACPECTTHRRLEQAAADPTYSADSEGDQ